MDSNGNRDETGESKRHQRLLRVLVLVAIVVVAVVYGVPRFFYFAGLADHRGQAEVITDFEKVDNNQSTISKISYLQPSTFSELPDDVIHELESRGCIIPQVYGERKPQNVIRGEFAKKGQLDWAVLCSINKQSSILIFWGTSKMSTSSIAQSPDSKWLQGMGDGDFA
jgi:hypothetical protein